MIPNLQENKPGNRKAETPASDKKAGAMPAVAIVANLTKPRCLRYFYSFLVLPETHSGQIFMPKHPTALPDFEAALVELESIVSTMESGQIPLNDALASYQRGVTLLRHCQQTLVNAESQIKILEQGSLRDFVAGKDVAP